MEPDAKKLFVNAAQAADYASSRPTYPPSVFEVIRGYLEQHGASTRVCADIATGSGQAAGGLAGIYDSVIGIDASAAQVEAGSRSPPAPNVSFQVGTAEATGLGDDSVDGVCVAEALHWFEPEKFWAEAHRILRPGGVIAIIAYSGSSIVNNEAANKVFNTLFYDALGPYWHPNKMIVDRLYVDAGYQPPEPLFTGLKRVEGLSIERWWGVDDAVGNCRSWSGYTTWMKEKGVARGSPEDLAVLLGRDLARTIDIPPAAHGQQQQQQQQEKPFHFRWPTVVMLARKA